MNEENQNENIEKENKNEENKDEENKNENDKDKEKDKENENKVINDTISDFSYSPPASPHKRNLFFNKGNQKIIHKHYKQENIL